MNVDHFGIGKDDVFEIFLQKKKLESTGKIYRLEQVLQALEVLSSSLSSNLHSSLIQNYGIDLKANNLLNDGIVCKVLSPESSGWKPGKLEVRIQINFIPDAPQELEDALHHENDRESELDELRKIT